MIVEHIPSVETYTSPYHDIGTCKFFCNTCGAQRRIEIEQLKSIEEESAIKRALFKEQQNTERARQSALNAQERLADEQQEVAKRQKRAADSQERYYDDERNKS
jgi:hypothetical protein